jgi:hypothetical protein
MQGQISLRYFVAFHGIGFTGLLLCNFLIHGLLLTQLI